MAPDALATASPQEAKSPGEIEACLARVGEAVYAREKALPVIARSSPERLAWRDWRREHGLPVSLMDKCERWTVPLLWPPTDLASLDADCAEGSSVAALLKKADAAG